jgi:hypothetical protein
VCNVEEASADKGNALSEKVQAFAKSEGNLAVVVSAKIESEIAILPFADQKDYLDAVGLHEPGLNRVIRAGYELLGLFTYFTVGPKEARAWTIARGTKAPAAAPKTPRKIFGAEVPIKTPTGARIRMRIESGRPLIGDSRPIKLQTPTARAWGLRRAHWSRSRRLKVTNLDPLSAMAAINQAVNTRLKCGHANAGADMRQRLAIRSPASFS